MLQVHFQVDPTDRKQLGVLLAAMNAVADFLMHAGPSVADSPQQSGRVAAPPASASFGTMGQGQPIAGAPAPAPAPAASKTRTRKPKDNGTGALPGQAELPMGQPMPPAYQQPMGQLMSAPQVWPQQGQGMPMQSTLGGGAGEESPDIKTQLHNALRDFATHFGSNALQGLLIAFGVDKRSDLPLARAEEIFHYIRAAYAQQQQAQGPVA